MWGGQCSFRQKQDILLAFREHQLVRGDRRVRGFLPVGAGPDAVCLQLHHRLDLRLQRRPGDGAGLAVRPPGAVHVPRGHHRHLQLLHLRRRALGGQRGHRPGRGQCPERERRQRHRPQLRDRQRQQLVRQLHRRPHDRQVRHPRLRRRGGHGGGLHLPVLPAHPGRALHADLGHHRRHHAGAAVGRRALLHHRHLVGEREPADPLGHRGQGAALFQLRALRGVRPLAAADPGAAQAHPAGAEDHQAGLPGSGGHEAAHGLAGDPDPGRAGLPHPLDDLCPVPGLLRGGHRGLHRHHQDLHLRRQHPVRGTIPALLLVLDFTVHHRHGPGGCGNGYLVLVLHS
mmetsp:Transcript_45776/g.71654  ORF Transcript_45776/g.71654 Transcript_45776/m.71654 type:complete len:343 (-) Transcript_45776:212-1240(-)